MRPSALGRPRGFGFSADGGGRHAIREVMVGVLCVSSAGAAWAAPVVREASGPNAVSIQAAVDQFRSDLGANNGVVAGSQPAVAGRSTGTVAVPQPPPPSMVKG